MNVDQSVAILKAVAELLGVLVWPAVALFILTRFRSSIGEFLSNLSEFTLKAAGVEATAKRQVEAAAALGAAVAVRTGGPSSSEGIAEQARAVGEIVVDAVTPRVVRRVGDATVLWVDDRPENNRFERQALEALGVRFELSTSTEDALEKLGRRAYDVIISDMGRPPDSRAGYTLLDALRQRRNQTPFIIYAGSDAPEHKEEARRHGALGSTNRPGELFQLVLSAILGRTAPSAPI